MTGDPSTVPSGLHRIAAVVSPLAAIASIAITLYQGHNNRSVLILVLFAGWVSMPFVTLALAERFLQRRGTDVGMVVDLTTLLVAAASVAIYARFAFGTPWKPPAAPFTITGPALVLLSMAIVGAAALAAKKR